MVVAEDRVVEIYGLREDGSWRSGSGYAVGGGLVLSAAHVIRDQGAWSADIRVRRSGTVDLFVAHVRWAGDEDAVLLEVRGPGWAGPRAVRWGRLVGAAPLVPGEATGFPEAQRLPDGVRDTEQVTGTVNPGTGRKAGLLAVDVDTAPLPSRPDPWGGMSGAAFLCEGLLVAVIVRHATGFGGRRLLALPAAAFVPDPGFGDAVERATGTRPVLEPVEFVNLLLRADPPRSPAGLLRAESGAVRFAGRQRLRRDLWDWCSTDAGFALRLLVGPGGQGKTRLGLRVAAEARDRGWVAGVLSERAGTAEVARLARRGVPTLLVVDYAESRAEQIAALVTAGGISDVPLRVLLLARAAGDWWRQLLAATPGLTADRVPEPERLGGLADDDDTAPAALWEDAVSDLSVALGDVRGYRSADPPLVASIVATGPPTPGPATVLEIQLGALVALLSAVGESGEPQETAAASTVLLRHERRYWTDAARSRGLVLDPRTLEAAVAAATLLGANDEGQAMDVVRGLPGLRDQPEDRRTAVIWWLHETCGSSTRFWEGVRPDVIGEDLVGQVLTERPDAFGEVSGRCATDQAEHAVTLLARLMERRPGLADRVDGLIAANLGTLGAATLAVAPRLADDTRLVAPVDRFISRGPDVDPAVLRRLVAALPQDGGPSHDRRAARVLTLLAGVLAQELQEQDHVAELAVTLTMLASRLSALGMTEQALGTGRSAVDLWRLYREPGPDVRGHLVRALHNHGLHLHRAGRRKEGLRAVREAVGLLRTLDDPEQDAALARGLTSLAAIEASSGRRRQALATAGEAVALVRRLPAEEAAELAVALHIRSMLLLAEQQGDEAAALLDDVVANYRGAAETSGVEPGEDVATALHAQAQALAVIKDFPAALELASEAAAIRRRLLADGAKSARDLAGTEDLLARIHAVDGRPRDREEHAREAVRMQREAGGEGPAVAVDLADRLVEWGEALAILDRFPEANTATDEAVGLLRALPLRDRWRNRGHLVHALALTACLAASSPVLDPGRRHVAVRAAQEAILLRRRPFGRRSGRAPKPEDVWSALDRLHGLADRDWRAHHARRQALRLLGRKSGAHPLEDIYRVAELRSRESQWYEDHKRWRKAVAEQELAVAGLRALHDAEPGAWGAELAGQLANLAWPLARFDLAAARGCFTEAAGLFQQALDADGTGTDLRADYRTFLNSWLLFATDVADTEHTLVVLDTTVEFAWSERVDTLEWYTRYHRAFRLLANHLAEAGASEDLARHTDRNRARVGELHEAGWTTPAEAFSVPPREEDDPGGFTASAFWKARRRLAGDTFHPSGRLPVDVRVPPALRHRRRLTGYPLRLVGLSPGRVTTWSKALWAPDRRPVVRLGKATARALLAVTSLVLVAGSLRYFGGECRSMAHHLSIDLNPLVSAAIAVPVVAVSYRIRLAITSPFGRVLVHYLALIEFLYGVALIAYLARHAS
ncbi:hypothetical protein ACWERV_13120 [Streptomyces sp. NPDC004031]